VARDKKTAPQFASAVLSEISEDLETGRAYLNVGAG
jgi:hypothetical protein